jgi:hypothetical protein
MASYVHGTVLEWGNSLGVRLRKADLQALGVRAKQKVKVQIVPLSSPLEELYGWGKREGIRISASDIRRNRRELEGEWDR